RRRLRPARLLSILVAAGAIVAAILVTGVGRQGPTQATRGADTSGTKPSLPSGARPPMPAGAALTSNVVSTSQASTPPSPLRGAGGSGAVRPVRRHGVRSAPTSAAPSSAVPVAPGARPPVAPIGFDPQNPYE
ncbi:MAG TPA: hypothetical protein VI456_16915, partial [Polyangia bacterium]